MNTSIQTMVDAVKAHAVANYNRDGWDYVVECYEDSEIAAKVQGCKSAADAIRRMGEIVKVKADRRADIVAESF